MLFPSLAWLPGLPVSHESGKLSHHYPTSMAFLLCSRFQTSSACQSSGHAPPFKALPNFPNQRAFVSAFTSLTLPYNGQSARLAAQTQLSAWEGCLLQHSAFLMIRILFTWSLE